MEIPLIGLNGVDYWQQIAIFQPYCFCPNRIEMGLRLVKFSLHLANTSQRQPAITCRHKVGTVVQRSGFLKKLLCLIKLIPFVTINS